MEGSWETRLRQGKDLHGLLAIGIAKRCKTRTTWIVHLYPCILATYGYVSSVLEAVIDCKTWLCMHQCPVLAWLVDWYLGVTHYRLLTHAMK
jgi:hypothetical protein